MGGWVRMPPGRGPFTWRPSAVSRCAGRRPAARHGASGGPRCATGRAAQDPLADYVRQHYTKFEYRDPGARRRAAVHGRLRPEDVRRPVPILMCARRIRCARTASTCTERIGPSEKAMKEGFIFVYQDVRGRYMSEGTWARSASPQPVEAGEDGRRREHRHVGHHRLAAEARALQQRQGRHVGRVVRRASTSSAGMIDAHPALVAASPQAPVTDVYLGDDSFHNGAFMLAANFGFYAFFQPREGEPPPRQSRGPGFDYGTPDGYQFYLGMGPLWTRRREVGPPRESVLPGEPRAHARTTSSGARARSGATSRRSRQPCSRSADGTTRRTSWARCGRTAHSRRTAPPRPPPRHGTVDTWRVVARPGVARREPRLRAAHRRVLPRRDRVPVLHAVT